MRILGALLLALHGVAHLVGFRAAFWPATGTGERTSLLGGLLGLGPAGSKALGVMWLLLALSYVVSAAMALLRVPTWVNVALAASGTSLVMCALFWPEARIGLYLDVAIIVVVLLVSRSSGAHLAATLDHELRSAALPVSLGKVELVDEQSIASLPRPVQRYLRFMGAVGRPRDWSLRARFKARFRRQPGQWLSCEALQYDTRLKPARFFVMQLSLGGALPVTVRDTYVNGRGTMRAKAFDLFRVVDGSGYEIDLGELVTYLNDAILMAPSLLLGPETTWREVDERTFDVTLRDGSLSVTARVWLDERGAPVDFSTRDRFFDGPEGRVRTEWRTPVSGWQEVEGRRLPTRAEAVWQLASGPFSYADFSIDPGQVAFNVPPY